jgi:hypothetical protein
MRELPPELLKMIVSFVDPLTRVDFWDGDKKYRTTQLLVLFWVSRLISIFALEHPFWLDPDADFGQLVPYPFVRESDCSPKQRIRRAKLYSEKTEKLYTALFQNEYLKGVMQRRTSWTVSSLGCVKSVCSAESTVAIEQLRLVNLKEDLHPAIEQLVTFCPDLPRLEIYEWLAPNCRGLRWDGITWLGLEHLYLNLSHLDGVRRLPFPLKSFHLGFQPNFAPCFKVHSDLGNLIRKSIDSFTELSISNTTGLCQDEKHQNFDSDVGF